MTTRRPRRWTLALAAVAWIPVLVAAGEPEVVSTALDGDGQLVSLLKGTYGELFSDGAEADPATPVLALRRTLPQGQQRLEVVPATLDQEAEGAARLVVEPLNGYSYVLWESWTGLIYSHLRVITFDGQVWGEPIEISDHGFAWRTSPAFAVTRDSFADISRDEEPVVRRTVLHVLWSVENEAGGWDTEYAPIVLEDGEYVGSHPVLVLDHMLAAESEVVGNGLGVAPVIRTAESENRVVVGFSDDSSGLVSTMTLELAAGELSILGSVIAEEIERALTASETTDDAGVEEVLTVVRARLQSYEDAIKPEILAALIAELESHLRTQLTNGPSDPHRVGDAARAQLIDVGFRLTDGEMRRVNRQARAQLIDVGIVGGGMPRNHPHVLRSSLVSTRILPPSTAPPQILLSSDGGNLMLVWKEPGLLRYRSTSSEDRWTPAQQIQLTDHLNADRALTVLQERLDHQ